jgi:hypothetical protein
MLFYRAGFHAVSRDALVSETTRSGFVCKLLMHKQGKCSTK